MPLPLAFPAPQEVTDQIRQRTGHLPGVAIAVMGCIVNGPGGEGSRGGREGMREEDGTVFGGGEGLEG